MDMNEQIEMTGIVPVVVLNDASDAEPLAKALCDGGLPCAEVTFRTDAAEESIKKMVKANPDMLVGAGTVLTTEQVDRALGAGAKFIVSPGLNPTTVEYCQKKGVPIYPGISSAGQIETALSLGLKVVKFFPAEQAGGLAMIKALSAPFPMLRFMPTGGINADNLNSYLAFDKVIACGGSWMVKGDLVKARQFDKIRELTEEAVMKMLGFYVKHVGINSQNESEAKKMVDAFHYMFGFNNRPIEKAFFIAPNESLEIMKLVDTGTHGHIAIGTNSVARAKYALERKGIKFDESTKAYDDKGKLRFIYLEEEFNGFKVHLVNK